MCVEQYYPTIINNYHDVMILFIFQDFENIKQYLINKFYVNDCKYVFFKFITLLLQ